MFDFLSLAIGFLSRCERANEARKYSWGQWLMRASELRTNFTFFRILLDFFVKLTSYIFTSISQLKFFPEGSRMPIYGFLGIPYGESTDGSTGNRFLPPVPTKTWNKTYYAREFKPICPQLETFEEQKIDSRGPKFSEQCLYLNIWTPETAVKMSLVPVLVVITGEESTDWSSTRISGQDLAAEGIVIVTIHYRTNVFGWLSLNTSNSKGNLALLDQKLAFTWIKENIQQFGGDTNSISLLGHGSMGSFNAIYHLLSPETKSNLNEILVRSKAFLLLILRCVLLMCFSAVFKSNNNVWKFIRTISYGSRRFGGFYSTVDLWLIERRSAAQMHAVKKLAGTDEGLWEYNAQWQQ